MVAIFMLFGVHSLYGCKLLTLEEAVEKYALHTDAARAERLRLKNESLSYMNYKRSFLPSLYLDVQPFDFNHSLRMLQNAVDGSYFNVDDFSSNSSIELGVEQKLFHTGGTFSLRAGYSFLREYSMNRNNFTSIPLFLSYTQPFWGGRRSNMMERGIKELEYRCSVANCCSAISLVQQEVLVLYLTSYLSALEKEQAYSDNHVDDTLLQITRFKYEEGYVTEYELNQMELQFLESGYFYEHAASLYKENMRRLCTFLGLSEETDICSPDKGRLPCSLDEEAVDRMIGRNNPLYVNNQVRMRQAEYELFQKIKETRFNGELSVNYGLNQYAETFGEAFRRPNSQQSVAVGFSIPVFQWSINRNKREMARNEYEMVRLEVEMSEKELINERYDCVYGYNSCVHTCDVAERTYELSRKQYRLAAQKFALGKISVYELTSKRQERYAAMRRYYEALRDLYLNYYKLRHLALYDFVRMKPLREIFAV